jgi:outer membrane receptor protein involved in Fe transport
MLGKTTKKIFGLMIFTLLLLGASLQAQVKVSGKVVDVNDEATLLGGVTVSVGAVGVVTDSTGTFSLQVENAPTIAVRFAIDGEDSILTLTTEPGKKEYDVVMAFGKKSDFKIGVVTFTESRRAKDLAKLTGSMDVISQKKVDMQISSDIKESLVQNSGVDIIDGQPNIRGSSGYAYGVGSRVMVMLDGLPLLSPDASFAQFDLIPTDNISQIEVMKGASSVLYGSSAMGGVINVLMADAPTKPKTSIRLRGGGFDAPSDKALDWDGNKFAKSAGINVFHSQKIGIHDFTALVDLWHDTGFRYNNSSTKGRAQILTKFRSKKNAGLTYGLNASMRFDSSTTFLFWDSYHPADTLVTFSGDTSYNSLGALSGANSARSQFNTSYTADPFFKFLTKKQNLHYYRGRIIVTSNKNNTNQSSLNTMIYNDYQFSTRIWDGRINWVSGGTASLNLVRGGALYGGNHHSINTAVYSQMDAQLTANWNVTAGGRFDNWNIDGDKNEAAPIFRLGTNYEIKKGTNVRASIGQAFRSPSIAERFTNTFASGLTIAPNPDLLVEKGYSMELGFRQGFIAGTEKRGVLGYLDLAAFSMNYNNMIEFGVKPPPADSFDPFNLRTVFWAKNYAHARTSGFEATAMVQYTHDKFRFDLNGGITFIDAINLNPGADSAQADLLNTIGPQNRPFNFDAYGMLIGVFAPDTVDFKRHDNPRVLKYRSRWLNRVSATVGYGKFNLTCNYRYKSPIVAIDQFLYVAIPGAADFVLSHPKGYSLVDFIFSAQATKAMQVSVSAKNAFNTEYVVLPGIIGEQRSFNFQVKYVF